MTNPVNVPADKATSVVDAQTMEVVQILSAGAWDPSITPGVLAKKWDVPLCTVHGRRAAAARYIRLSSYGETASDYRDSLIANAERLARVAELRRKPVVLRDGVDGCFSEKIVEVPDPDVKGAVSAHRLVVDILGVAFRLPRSQPGDEERLEQIVAEGMTPIDAITEIVVRTGMSLEQVVDALKKKGLGHE